MTRRIRLFGLLLILGSVSCVAPSRAQEPDSERDETRDQPIYADTLTHVETWGSYAVAVENERIYFGHGNRLVVADVSDPSRPRELSRLSFPYPVRDVHVEGAHLYVADDAGGLRIVDATDPVEPIEVASVSFADRADAVDVEGGYAYVAARSAGLRILDVTDPTQPKTVGRFSTEDQVAGVTVDGDIAHVAAVYRGHRIVDVSDPSDPVEIGFAVRGSYDQGYAWDVAVDDSLAYVANVEIGLRRVDVSDPADQAPTLQILQTVHYTNDNRYRRELLSRPAAVTTSDRWAYVADQDAGLRIVDLSDSDTLRIAGTADTPDRAMDVAVSGDFAYVADRYAGVRVIDVSDPFAPREIGFWDEDQHAVRVLRRGRTLYVGDRHNGLWALDPSTPTAPEPTGFHHFPNLRTFDVDGNRAVVADDDGTLRLLGADFATVLGEYGLPAPAEAVRLVGSRLYAAAGSEGLLVLDVADPEAMHRVGRFVPAEGPPSDPEDQDREAAVDLRYYPDPPAAWSLTLDGDRLYAGFDDGLRVFDLSGGGDPALLTHLHTTERAMQIVRDGDYLFGAFDDGVRVLDLADPARPEPVTAIETPSYARALALDEDYLFVGDLTGGVLVLDVSDPTRPRHSATLPVDRGRVVDLARDGRGHLFTAAGSGGLRVIRIDDPTSPRALGTD